MSIFQEKPVIECHHSDFMGARTKEVVVMVVELLDVQSSSQVVNHKHTNTQFFI